MAMDMVLNHVPQHPRILPETPNCSISRYLLVTPFNVTPHRHSPFRTRQETKVPCQVRCTYFLYSRQLEMVLL